MSQQRISHPYEVRTIKYGPSDSQVGDLYLPNASRRPIACLLHGGFWRMPYGRDEFNPVARDLASRNSPYGTWSTGASASLAEVGPRHSMMLPLESIIWPISLPKALNSTSVASLLSATPPEVTWLYGALLGVTGRPPFARRSEYVLLVRSAWRLS